MPTRNQPEQCRIFEYVDHWLVQRKDTPNYHIYWCKPGSRRVHRKSTHTADLELAKQQLVEFANSKQRPVEQGPEAVSIHDALNEFFIRHCVGKPGERTAKDAIKKLAAYLDSVGIEVVSDLTLEAQERFVHWRREQRWTKGRSLSNATINRELAVLRASLRDFWKRGILDRPPYVMMLQNPPPRERFLTQEEFQSLIKECIEPHLNLYVMLAVHTMQRPSAILELTTDRVDFQHNRIDFRVDPGIVHNKRRPVVPMSETIRGILTNAVNQSVSGYVTPL